MAVVTRLGLEGYGVRRVSFAPKPAAGSVIGPYTRFGLEGYGVRRVAFTAKPASGGSTSGGDWLVLARRRGRR